MKLWEAIRVIQECDHKVFRNKVNASHDMDLRDCHGDIIVGGEYVLEGDGWEPLFEPKRNPLTTPEHTIAKLQCELEEARTQFLEFKKELRARISSEHRAPTADAWNVLSAPSSYEKLGLRQTAGFIRWLLEVTK